MMGVFFVFVRRHAQQFLFDFNDGFAWRQAGAVAEAENMRVDGDCGLAEGGVKYDIGGLAANAWQRFQQGALVRHLAAVLFKQNLAGGDDVPGLGVVKADGLDEFAEAFNTQLPHFVGRGRDGEKSGSRFIDANISGLGGKNDGDE